MSSNNLEINENYSTQRANKMQSLLSMECILYAEIPFSAESNAQIKCFIYSSIWNEANFKYSFYYLFGKCDYGWTAVHSIYIFWENLWINRKMPERPAERTENKNKCNECAALKFFDSLIR